MPPLTTLSAVAVATLLAACTAIEPNSLQSTMVDEVAAPAPTIEGEPRRLCFFLEGETLTSGVQLTLGPGSAVLGETYGTIHNEEAGYYAFYSQAHQGTISGTTISVTTETTIEADFQIEQESWTLLPDRLVRTHETYPAADCEIVDGRFATLYD